VIRDPDKHAAMRIASRAYALTMSWDAVFDGVYSAYKTILNPERSRPQAARYVITPSN
jgi:hypothetical protein